MARTWSRASVAGTVVLCLLLSALPTIVQSQDANEVAAGNHLVKGLEAYERGEYARAIDHLQQVVEVREDSAVAWYYLGTAQFKQEYLSLVTPTQRRKRDYSSAQQSLETALELAPGRAGARMYLGRIFEERSDWAEAGKMYSQELAVRDRGDQTQVRVALARLDYKAGDYAEAVEVLNRVIAREPLYVEARYYLGRSLIGLGKYQQAIEQLEQGLDTLKEWRDKVFHLLRLNYEAIAPDEPYRASEIVENWDELRKEIWELRKAKARPEAQDDSVAAVLDKYKRAQHFALDRHMWPQLHKAIGDAHMGLRNWTECRNSYRNAMEPREGEGTEQDPDAWAKLGLAYFMQGKELFEDKGLLLSAIKFFYAAEGDKLPTPAMEAAGMGGVQDQQRRRTGQRQMGGRQTQFQGEIRLRPEELLDGYARALYVLGLPKETDTPVEEMEGPEEPKPIVAQVFDGLGQVYLYQANTYATDEPRDIESHTHAEAIKMFDRALLYKSDYVPALLHKAQAFLSMADQADSAHVRAENYDKAISLLERTIPLDPDNDKLHGEYARALVGGQRLSAAKEAAERALKLNKENVVALNTLGLIHYFNNECVESVDYFRKAIDLDDSDYQAFVNLGNALYCLRSWGRAQAEYIRALERLPESTIANTSSERPYVIYLIARTLQERGLHDRAIKLSQRALSMRTDFYNAQRLLAAAYSGKQQWTAAEEALKSALTNVPSGDTQTKSGIHAQLGQVYEAQGQIQEAIAQYQIALAQFQGNTDAIDGLERLRAAAR